MRQFTQDGSQRKTVKQAKEAVLFFTKINTFAMRLKVDELIN
jgi:hypothetical protein